MNFFGFSEPATPIMEGIIDFHNYIMFFLVLILLFVLVMLCIILLYFCFFYEFSKRKWDIRFRRFIFKNNKINHGTELEIIWTITPAIILITLAIPSFSLLYSMDELMVPNLTLKVIGHQWYWSYEYTDSILVADESISDIEFDSYMIPETDLSLGDYRLLEVTESLVLPIKTNIRVLVTSSDVLHSFSINSLGIKADAVPGRLNQLAVFLKRNGVFYGQCSEICGVSHGMMPIVIRAVYLDEYLKWLFSFKLK